MDTPVILAVDDHENTLQLLSTSLELYGYQVVTATDAKQALKLLASQRVDMLITDWLMPVMDGEEFTRTVNAKHKELPKIVLSGSNSPLSEGQHTSLGILAWIKKPFRFKEIQTVVTDTLNDHQCLAFAQRNRDKSSTH